MVSLLFEQDFEAMLREYETSLDDKKRFTALVKDLFPDQVKNVNLLLMAYNMGIAQDIQSVPRINNTFAFRYVKRLMEDYGLSRVNADWIVSVWCSCYGNKVLGKICDISVQRRGAGPAIKEEQLTSGKQYGDLFTYCRSSQGTGMAVTGFLGDNKRTIIFQNKSGNTPVIEIADNSFNKEAVEEAILTEGIAYIGKRAFAECNQLHQVVLPVSMKEIGDEAFSECPNLKSISLPMQLERIGEAVFKGSGLKTLVIPKSVYWIGDSILAECSELENISIPKNVDRIPNSMFEGCSALKKVLLSDGLNGIGDKAFFGCSSLDLLIIPDSVSEIGQDAFMGTDKQFIIQCSFGSYAEEYARKNKIKYQLV